MDRYGSKGESDVMSYDEALEKAGHGRFQYIITVVGGLILFSSYISVGAVAYILPAAQCDLNMDSEAKGKLVSVGFLGLIVSCHLWGFMSDTSGRRYILIRCLLLDGLLYIVTSLIPYYSVILVLRLINGFVSSGAVASLFVYVGEFISSKYRTRALMIVAMIASFQYFLTPIYAWLTISGKWQFELYPGLILKPWRLYYAVNGIPSLVCVALIYFLPESPKFLLAKGQTEKSINILKRIHKINGKHDNEEFLVKNIKINENEMVAKLEVGKNKALAFLKLMWNQTVPLFKRPHRLNITLICLSQFLLYFCNGGIFLWLPETMNRLATYRYETNNEHATFCDVVQYGRNSNTANFTESKDDLAINLTTSTIQPIEEPLCNEDVDSVVYLYLGTVGVIQATNFGIIVIVSNMFDKKYILVVYTIFSFLSAIAVEYVKVTDFAAYDSFLLIFFSGAVIPMINSLVVELFPTNLRGMAGCLTLMCCRLGTVTTNIIAGSIIDQNCSELIWCFIVAMGICVITISIMPTKLKEEKEVTHLNNA